MSSQMFAKEDFVDRASFKADHTIEIYSQQPGTLSIQSFWMDELIRLLCFTSRFEIKLKNSFPCTFKRAIGWKSLRDKVVWFWVYSAPWHNAIVMALQNVRDMNKKY